MNRGKVISCIILGCFLVGCQTQTNDFYTNVATKDQLNEKFIGTQMDYRNISTKKVSNLEDTIEESIGYDLRFKDISNIDLNEVPDDFLSKIAFDSSTIWPDHVPQKEDIEKAYQLGKNPGLGIKQLHEQGITGKGVSVAIIDQPLDPNAPEIKDSIVSYEQIHSAGGPVSMHGPAVSSILVGNTIGVAPDADLYYIDCTFVDKTEEGMEVNLTYLADCIDHLIEKNKYLDQPIRVISISRGFYKDDATVKGSNELYEAIERAKKENVLVITCSPEQNYDYGICGLERDPLSDPDDYANYTQKYSSQTKSICVPIDSRTTLGMQNENDFVYFGEGGLSWSSPWLAGAYALALQVDPQLSPEEFLKLVYETGHESNGYYRIADINKVIEQIQ